ncbi:retron St85 family effector protein [Roseibium sp. MB-4]
MSISASDPRDDFIKLVDLKNSKVQLEPRIVFICGGPVDPRETKNHSIRNMFMNLSGGLESRADGFVLAENFKDWERGYKSLSEFENDIAFISSLVVVILESEGALTEFGLFFANIRLREKLVVVLHNEFHQSESFIKFGLLNPMEHHDQKSVRVYEIDHRKINDVQKDEVKDILDDVLEHCDEKNKTERFNSADRGHQIFLIFQIIDLFLALTKSEISSHLNNLSISLSKSELDSALYILRKFNLVGMEKKSSQYFYYVPTGLTDRIDLSFSNINRRYDSPTVKIEVAEYYRIAAKTEPGHKRRMKVIQTATNGGS